MVVEVEVTLSAPFRILDSRSVTIDPSNAISPYREFLVAAGG
jgi:hypothetical protein